MSNSKTWTKADMREAVVRYSALAVLVIMLAVNIVFTKNFFSLGTFWNIVTQSCTIILTGMGMTILTLLCMYISKQTKFGMAIYAVGGNEEAARMMGLKVDRIKIAAFTICGAFAALAGMLLASRLYTAQPTAGDAWETTAIAMCALGGVKLTGGEGRFSGAFFGILVVSLINTVFNYIGSMNSWWQNIVMGLLILVSIGLQSDVLHGMLPFKKKQVA